MTLKGNEVEVSGAPEWITVLPLGHVTSSKGEFNVDEESLLEMKSLIKQRGVDLVIDYEHQTLKGVQAPAAGWVKELLLKDSGIQARVEWTPQGMEYLKNKEYRYLSPVITVRKPDGKAVGLHSLALTNTPAIEGMPPIVNSQNYEGGTQSMDLEEFVKQLAKLLGLSEDADPEEIMQALKACVDENKSLKDTNPVPGTEKVVANKAVCELLGLKSGAPTDSVAAKIMELKGGIVDGVNLVQELNQLKQRNAKRDADEAVLLALKDGKITPAQKEWAESYALSDPKGFGSFAAQAPRVVPMGEISFSDVKALKSDKPDEAITAVCKHLGVSMEDYEKYGRI